MRLVRQLKLSSRATGRFPRADRPGTHVRHWGAAFSPDGSRVVTASDNLDGTARVWRTDGTGEPIVLRGGHNDDRYTPAFSPDGARVVTASDDSTARVWRTDGTGEPVVLSGHEDELNSAVFSPDGGRVVTTSDDDTARVWQADGTGEPLVLRGHEDDVWKAVFTPDATRVITAGDSTVRVWRVTWPGLLAYLRENLNACLTPKQRMRFLAESSSEAWEAYAACERRHGREPAVGNVS